MKFNSRNFFASLAGLVFLAGQVSAGSLEELQTLNSVSPEEYGKIYDKDLASATAGAAAGMTQQQLKQLMLQDLDSVRNMIAARYAPAGWKKEQFGWDLDAEIQKARDQVNASASFGVKEYQVLLRSLLNSMKDYHVSVSFHSTEAALLPLGITHSGGRYFISSINRKALPENLFPFRIGDEITAFDGKPVAEAVAALEKQAGLANVTGTDAGMTAMMALTVRIGAMGETVPQGPVSISVKPAGSADSVPFQLQWRYIPELIAQQPFVSKSAAVRIPMSWLALMVLRTPEAAAGPQASYALGHKDGFLPDFGEKLWEAPAGNAFRAYVYRSPAGGKDIGFVRIPTYLVENPGKLVKDFAALIPEFNQRAEALVIDQTNNPGGIVFYLYALASMLTDAPLAVPRHYMTLTQSDIADSVNFLNEAGAAKTDDEARALLGPDLAGYPVNLELLRDWAAFHKEVVKQWSAGKTMTSPLPVYGIASIKPDPAVRFAKPLLVLTNPLDFSGGDFFPAIMQDNKRAVTFGERTAGAGGVVKEYKRENNLLGVEVIKLTATIAERPDGRPIENLGVAPDIPYTATPADIQGGYAGYIKAADAAVSGLIK
ncbi:MAG: protease-like activity factor CPAF [Elusimicrobia bacterium]|nr:protease-like activity factor CPAF [Elusimicrobiota bacterium]